MKILFFLLIAASGWPIVHERQQKSIPRVIEKSEIGQGGSSDFSTGAREIAKGKDQDEEEKYEAKPTLHQSRFFNHERYKHPLMKSINQGQQNKQKISNSN